MINIKRIAAVLIGVCVALSSTFAQELPGDKTPIVGQLGGGIKLGPNLAGTTANWVAVGPSVSGYLNYQISPKVAFQQEVIFSQRGYQRDLVKGISGALSLSASALPDYMNLNAFMTYRLNKRLQVFAGPSLGTNLNRTASSHDDDEDGMDDEDGIEDEDRIDDDNGMDDEDGIDDEDGNARTPGFAGSIVSGMEYNLVGSISLSVRYNMGLLRKNDPTFGIKNHVFQLMLWYKF